jgi:hypothetical protein
MATGDVQAKDKRFEVRGHLIHLSGGRIVFLGQCDDKSYWHIAFRSDRDTDTFWQLSSEALDAFVKLYTNPTKHGEGPCDFPFKKVWTLVDPDVKDLEEEPI